MSDEQFLTIPSIPGEVKDDRHPGSIEVLNWSWLVSHATSGAAGGGADPAFPGRGPRRTTAP